MLHTILHIPYSLRFANESCKFIFVAITFTSFASSSLSILLLILMIHKFPENNSTSVANYSVEVEIAICNMGSK